MTRDKIGNIERLVLQRLGRVVRWFTMISLIFSLTIGLGWYLMVRIRPITERPLAQLTLGEIGAAVFVVWLLVNLLYCVLKVTFTNEEKNYEAWGWFGFTLAFLAFGVYHWRHWLPFR